MSAAVTGAALGAGGAPSRARRRGDPADGARARAGAAASAPTEGPTEGGAAESCAAEGVLAAPAAEARRCGGQGGGGRPTDHGGARALAKGKAR